MILRSKDFVAMLDDASGEIREIYYPRDQYKMNWIRGDYLGSPVLGYELQRADVSADAVTGIYLNPDRTVSLRIDRYVRGGRFCLDYTFKNISTADVLLNDDNTGLVFSYNCFFDKKENMLHTRCNSHVFVGGDVCTVQSVKLDGKPPYLVTRATEGRFFGYGLLTDIAVTPNASYDRGNIVIYPEQRVLKPGECEAFSFEFYFSETREAMSFVSSDRYSGFVSEEFEISVDFDSDVRAIRAECEGREIPFSVSGRRALAKVSFDTVGEKRVSLDVNGKRTFIRLNVLRPLSEILKRRVRFIREKQQMIEEGSPLDGAYLIYDRSTDSIYYNPDFRDHNCARERLSMGALVAMSLALSYDREGEESLRRHRAFIEREILDVHSGEVKDGIGQNDLRLYNYPWVSTYYLEWYNFSHDRECLLIAARVLHKYYSLGGEHQESPCISAYEILGHLEAEGLTEEYGRLKREFISHADSILRRRTASSSGEVSCANGMMNLMSTFLFQAFLLTGDRKYLDTTGDLLKISESFYDTQPDCKTYGIALRYWDMYWFGKNKAYGDTYPQWLSTLTAEMYYYCDLATGSDHGRLIRDNLFGNCSLYFDDGFAACGYLYPKRVRVFSSDPCRKNIHRPLGEKRGEHFDDFANDQDWALYHAVKYLRLER